MFLSFDLDNFEVNSTEYFSMENSMEMTKTSMEINKRMRVGLDDAFIT